MFTAIVLLFCWRKVAAQRVASVVGNFVSLTISIMLLHQVWNNGIQTMQAGNWSAPFGITFVADVFGSTLVLLTSIAGLAVSIFSTAGISKARMRFGYFPILHFLLMGLSGAFLTGDIFNLYVWFEIIIIASFVLMTLGGRKPQIEGGIKYVTMNLLASVIFLTAIGILYGLTGSLNMADLSLKVAQVQNRGLVNVTALLFFVGFGIKSAIFPLYFWLPSSYHTPPSAIAAIFGGLLTKVGVYAMLRVFTLIFVPDEFVRTTFTIIAGATLLTGVLGAIVKTDVRKIFSYLIVSHIGYMIAGLAMFNEAALTGALFYLVHDIMVKTNLFLICGLIFKIKGSLEFKEVGGLYDEYPKLSLLMAVVLFSLVGIPPLSGFWPKILLFQGGFSTGNYFLIISIIIASFFTLWIVAKIWAEIFWKTQPQTETVQADDLAPMKWSRKTLLVGPVLMLAIVSVYIGLGAENIMAVSHHIAIELLDPTAYINAVLGPVAAP
ncbi:proton-conducting transporter membrane subunit [Aridibaculum aurantiacum]|uniref:proton-conducting transporter transmembrane domain-containing protein n=1 Tax=Aridibaculum aurantiacum TaxID=2810307 RepID=UPI001A968329|nr:proton-conducting transporter membrane subunit [Aridibaculum aurantiacum]